MSSVACLIDELAIVLNPKFKPRERFFPVSGKTDSDCEEYGKIWEALAKEQAGKEERCFKLQQHASIADTQQKGKPVGCGPCGSGVRTR